MSKQEKKELAPALRFPEFRDKGEWELAPLKKLASRRTERNRDGKLVRVLTNSAEHGVVDQRDYFDKDIATQGNLENYFIVDSGDFVYNPRISSFAPVGPISKNNVAKGVMSPLYTVFRFKNPDSDFYAHYFKTSAWHLYMRQVGSTGARHDRMAITNDDFMAMPLPVPSPEEQQKIADCLAFIDELVTFQTQKLDNLKAHKKGLMQQLFPAEGETLPKLRFPEFRDKGEWEEEKFGSLIKINSGKGFKAAEYSKDGVRLLQIENVGYGTVKWNDNVVYLPKGYTLDHPELVLKEGDIVLALNRPVTNDELKIARLAKIDDTSILYQRVGKLELLSDDLSKEFIFQLCRVFVKEFVLKKSIGSDQPFISVTALYSQLIRIPSPKEQQKIADCLASIDELITAQTQKIDALKAHKKGLMQQLFPALETVDA